MKKQFEMPRIRLNGLMPFLPALFIRPEGRILCSPEHGKLCFEALETEFVPQNHLPLQGLENTSEVGVLGRLTKDGIAEA